MTIDLLAQAGHPDTPLEVLAELAHLHPELRVAIAKTPPPTLASLSGLAIWGTQTSLPRCA